jgi:hypothetical protein
VNLLHYGHDHQHDGGASPNSTGIGHNAPPVAEPVQWQTPHLPPTAWQARDRDGGDETDIDMVERAFVEGFMIAGDVTSFIRLANVPFSATGPGGTRLVLLRVEVDALTDVGSLTPHLGGASFRYDPLTAAAVSRRRRLRFAYFDGVGVRQLSFAEARRLETAD